MLHSMKARQVQWTTATKLQMWFNNLVNNLVELGFASKLNYDGDIHIPDDQLGHIINFDETYLSFDESSKRGGCPEVVL